MKQYPEVGQYLDLGYFLWDRSDAGHYWEEDGKPVKSIIARSKHKSEHLEGPFLLEKPQTTGYFQYHPLEISPCLFLEFAELEPTKEEILKFSDKYGTLLNQHENVPLNTPNHTCDENENPPWAGFTETRRSKGKIHKTVFGESLKFWQDEIEDMKIIVNVWEWLSKRDEGKLGNVIKWTDKENVYYSLDADKWVILASSDGVKAEVFSRLRYGDLTLPAQYLIQNQINKKLRKYITLPRLYMDSKNQLKQYLTPENLLAAMWFQFYQAAAGEKKFKRCAICQLWEDVTKNRSTWTKHPECAGRKRTSNYRKRKEEKEKGVIK